MKVGDDVVARMVNFSRSTTATYISKDGQLKTAAVNEPRFEKEGLLIEGQSTNAFNTASGTNFSWLSEGLTQSAGTAPLPFDVFQKTITSSTSNPTHTDRVLVDIYGMANPAASGGGPVTVSAIMFGDADAIVGAEPRFKTVSNLAITGVTNSAVRLTSGMVRVVWTGIITAGSAANFAQLQLSWLNRLPSVVAGCYQIEALPFASSYIPTNGAAVTRAADQVWLPAAGNRFIRGMYAVACEFDLLGRVLGGGFTRLVDFDNSGGTDRQHLSLSDGGQLQCVMGPSQVVAGVAGKLAGRAAMRMNNFTLNVMLDGVAGSSVTASGVGSSANNRIVLMNTNIFNIPTYGHIRNLRMWSKHPISNEQLRTAV